jgi:hypothetical protein
MSSERVPPGRSIASARPGDFILVHGTSWRSRVVTAYERFRFRGIEERHWAHWSHSALVVGSNGLIVEAGTKGVVLQDVRKYDGVDCQYVAIGATPAGRRAAVGFARSRVGRGYSRAAIARLGASVLTAGRIGPRPEDKDLCGGLVAASLGQAGEVFDRPPGLMLPADLARHYAVPATNSLGASLGGPRGRPGQRVDEAAGEIGSELLLEPGARGHALPTHDDVEDGHVVEQVKITTAQPFLAAKHHDPPWVVRRFFRVLRPSADSSAPLSDLRDR